MNLRATTNALVQIVNPDVLVTVFVSTGYTVGAGQKQIPTYDSGTTGYAQVQALNSDDIQHMYNYQSQDVIKSIFLKNQLHGIIRKIGDGGDYILIGNDKWIIQKIIEQWPDWTKAAIIMQTD